jgi:hypothetical protein
MSDNQKTGVLVLGYNAPYGPIGAYPKLTKALMDGNMTDAASNVQRGGPSSARLAVEKQLLLSGPKDLNKPQEPSKSITPQQPNVFEQVKTNVMNWFSPKPKTNIGPLSSSGQSNFIELPPIIQQAAQQVASSSGTKVPPFISPDSTGARINAKIYGIG